jgi:hypothetical protein
VMMMALPFDSTRQSAHVSFAPKRTGYKLRVKPLA